MLINSQHDVYSRETKSPAKTRYIPLPFRENGGEKGEDELLAWSDVEQVIFDFIEQQYKGRIEVNDERAVGNTHTLHANGHAQKNY